MAVMRVMSCPAPGPNPGMSSVELALWKVVRRAGLDVNVWLGHLYTFDELHAHRPEREKQRLATRQKTPFPIHCIRDRLDAMYSSDVLLFWGDFLHARHNCHAMGRLMVDAGIADTHDAAMESIYRHLYLSQAPLDVLNKSVVFGETTIFDRTEVEEDQTYTRQFERFMRNARRIWMRDVYSALRVQRVREDYTDPCLGVDCAVLLRPEDTDELEQSEWSASEVDGDGLVFLGRSHLPERATGRFVGDLSRKLGKRMHWLPWGDHTAFDRCAERFKRSCRGLEVRRVNAAPMLGDLFSLIKRASFVISDTYHVCVNAWRMGVPAVCIGQAVSKSAFNISSGKAYAWRDKRQTFFHMYDAMDYYVFVEEIADRRWRHRRIYQLSKLLADPQAAARVVRRLWSHRDNAEAQLVGELRKMLGQPAVAPSRPTTKARLLGAESDGVMNENVV